MSWLPCFKSSKGSKKCWKCWKGKSSIGDETSRKRKRRGICFSSKKGGWTCCFICDKSSKDEEPSRKRGKCGMGCFCCNGSAKDEDSSTKRTKCGMSCFKHTKNSSKEPLTRSGKGCLSCFCCCKPSKEEELSPGKEKGTSCCACFNSSKTTKCGMCCFKRNKNSSKEPLTIKEKGCTSCFHCCKPSKEEELRLGKEKGTSCCNLSKTTKCGMCCFKRNKKSSKEPLTIKEKGCTSCFHCCKSSKDEELRLGKEKGTSCCNLSETTKCGMCCFKGTKNSSKEPLTRKEKGCMNCFNCCKPSKEEELRLGKEKGTSCCACFKLSELMGCFRCFKSSKRIDRAKNTPQTESSKQRPPTQEIIRIGNENIAARVFTYHGLCESTQKFSPECLLGEGGLGKVYKGQLKDTNETIAVKKLNRNEGQENREFLIEVLMLSLLSHSNLVSLLGYCAEGDERFLVYDYMPLGSLQDHLLDLSPNNKPLDWKTRMKIAVGAAKGLEHLHDTANPPVIFRNLKASNILLDEDYNPRLADFGLDKFGPVRDKNHISTRVMGTYGYCAPEYALAGKLTVMSDIYSFGVVLLELITGRKAMDSTRPINEQRLVDWAMPRFKNKRNMVHMADPLLERNFPEKALYQALAVAAMCIQEEDTTRPLIKDVVNTLQFIATEMPEKSMNENQNHNGPQTEESIDESNTDKESLHSSHSDWQSCSTASEDEEEIKQADGVS